MEKQCAIIPAVLNKKGQKVDSKLFKDLLSYLPSREEAVRIYLITKSQDFISNWYPKLELDDCNEPTIASLLKHTNLNSYIEEGTILRNLNKKVGHYIKDGSRIANYPMTDKNYRDLLDRAIKFNTTSDFRNDYVARITKAMDSESDRVFYRISVEKRNKMNSLEADKMAYNEKLNDKLRDILVSHGISTGVLTELERRLGISGVTDFDVARTSAEGLIQMIRLAEGIKGEKALPEEFAHFALEAMIDNPLINRLLNYIGNNNLEIEILGDEYGSYVNAYDNDKLKLVKEAAGKLLAKHLLQEEDIKGKSYKNLLERVISLIKNFFKGFKVNEIQNALDTLDKEFSSLAKSILERKMDSAMKVENIKQQGVLYNLGERVERDKQVLQKIINTELKRLYIYQNRTTNSRFTDNQKEIVNDLEVKLIENNEIEGIYSFITESLNRLQSLHNRLIALNSTDSTESKSLNDKAKVLRDIRNYYYSYSNIVNDIRKAIVDEGKYEDNRYGQKVINDLDRLSSELNNLYIEYTNVSEPLFVEFIKPFIGDSIEIPFGKRKGEVIKAEELVNFASQDISFFDMWLDSMADSSAYILKIMDQAVKKAKENARLNTIDMKKKLMEAGIKLEQAGIKDTDWMFEKDSEGNLTGKYISEINYSLYKEAYMKMLNSLYDKYGISPVGDNFKAFDKERRQWINANTEIVGGKRIPAKSKYGNTVFSNLNSAQKEFYDTIMSIKGELDSLLPENYTTLTNTVKIRKDLLERVKSSQGVKEGTLQLWEAVKDQFIRRSDDSDFGDRATIKDFEDREVQKLPIYYTKLRPGESNNDISTDVVSTMIAYASMALDFSAMNEVIDTLELGRDYLRDNLEIAKTEGSKKVTERFNVLGRTIESKVFKRKEDSRILDRLNYFFDMQVYNRYMADEGTFGDTNIDKGKTANFINRLTSLNSLALNLLSSISNVTTGDVMMKIEGAAKEFFSSSDILLADREYGKALPEFLGELGSRVKNSKLALWSEMFDVLQEYETDIKNTNFDRKTWISRLGNSSALFVLNNAGEHWMQHRTSLALALNYKMKSPEGKTVSLWEAMEVVYRDPNNKALGSTLKVKDGYTKEDGSEFTREDIIKFTRKTAAINQRMHGIYNKLDRNAFQNIAIGRMAMMFRKWIKPSLNRRFGSVTKNLDLEEWTEGYYNTSYRFLKQLAKELKEGQFALIANWRNLDNREKANIKRALREVSTLLVLSLVLALVDWPDDDDKTWFTSMLEYQTRRLYTEIGVLVPGPSILDEGLKIIKSPAAGVNTMENLLNLIGLINPFNYEAIGGEDAIIQSGRYKGMNKATRLFYESPIIPMNKTIYRVLHPEEGIPFYKQ